MLDKGRGKKKVLLEHELTSGCRIQQPLFGVRRISELEFELFPPLFEDGDGDPSLIIEGRTGEGGEISEEVEADSLSELMRETTSRA